MDKIIKNVGRLNMKKILFIITSSKTYKNEDFYLDRVDLTKQLDVRNNWLMSAVHFGHDFVFVDGDNEVESYEPELHLFHASCSDAADLSKQKRCYEWCLENKEFDKVYFCDDSTFININNIENLDNVMACCDSYVPGELYCSIKCAHGQRMYYLSQIMRFYKDNGRTDRKIIINFPLDDKKVDLYKYSQPIPRYYDFIKDKNNWEYHGGYKDSVIKNLFDFWPYASRSSKYFVINAKMLEIYNQKLSNNLLNKFRQSLVDPNNLFLCSEKDGAIKNWKLDNNLRTKLRLDFEGLERYNYYKGG